MKETPVIDLNEIVTLPCVIAVIGDTHIPRDQQHLPDCVLERLRTEKPSVILHTGDVTDDKAMNPLREIAPLYIAHGNRDLVNWFRYPAKIKFVIGKYKLLLFHGHGDLLTYLRIKVYATFVSPYVLEVDRLTAFPKEAETADICVFGHSHTPVLKKRNHRLLLNPGSGFRDRGSKIDHNIGLGLLYFDEFGSIYGEILDYNHEWAVKYDIIIKNDLK